MLIAQITDCHIVERGALQGGRADTAAGLRAAVERLVQLDPDLVLATGDLVNDGTTEQYDHLAELLAPIRDRVLALPGNHDDRTLLRDMFPNLPRGGPNDPVSHHVDVGGVRVVTLDTTVPGAHGGRLGTDQLAWLDRMLAEAPERPTIIAQHHPPFVTGIGWMDEVGLADARDEAAVVRGHPQVMGVLCGHVHRPVIAPFAGTVASCWPSTGAQVALDLDGARYRYSTEPASLAVHRWSSVNGLCSHLLPVEVPSTWLPDWAEAELDASSSPPEGTDAV